MGKRCIGCCGGNSFCGCCCTPRGATITYALIGITLAVGVITPPTYVYCTDQDFAKLFPLLKIAREFLTEVTELKFANNPEVPGMALGIEDELVVEQTSREKYRLAIFQLLDDIKDKALYISLVSFCMGCVNIPANFMLLIGSIGRYPCLMLPWLAITLLEHLLIGIPIIVFFGIISLYLAAQLELYVVAGALIGSIVMVFLISLSTWFTVHGCYSSFYSRQTYTTVTSDLGQSGAHLSGSDIQLTQPLLYNSNSRNTRGNIPPSLPCGPGQGSSGSNGYNQYPQYYPPHQGRQLPSAPPVSRALYPQLPNV